MIENTLNNKTIELSIVEFYDLRYRADFLEFLFKKIGSEEMRKLEKEYIEQD